MTIYTADEGTAGENKGGSGLGRHWVHLWHCLWSVEGGATVRHRSTMTSSTAALGSFIIRLRGSQCELRLIYSS